MTHGCASGSATDVILCFADRYPQTSQREVTRTSRSNDARAYNDSIKGP
jgi:hypothetical protein